MVLLLFEILPGQATTTTKQEVTTTQVTTEIKVTIKNRQKQLPHLHTIIITTINSQQNLITLKTTKTILLYINHLASLIIVQSQLY